MCRKLWIQFLFAFILVAVFEQRGIAQTPDISEKVKALFVEKCADCHGSELSKPKAGFGKIELVDELLRNAKYVKRYDPANSLLYQYLTGAQTPQMPKGDDPLTEAELSLVRTWIGEAAAGADPSKGPAVEPKFVARRVIDDEEIVKLIHRDLKTRPESERRHYRYISYTNLWNERLADGASASDQAQFERDTDKLLEAARLGFVKMLNSLSWSPTMVFPQAIDKEQLVQRIDLRGLLCFNGQHHWSGSAQWDMLCARYPYGRTLGLDEEKEIAQWLGTELACVRADWFVFATSRPPLYHDLLGLPGGDGKPGADYALERMLGVDVRTNILEGKRTARAGIRDKQSGVSQHNRLIERHEMESGGYYWKSYDFGESVGTGNLVLHPFGPANLEGLPEEQREFAFEHAGGEIIFSLPNGLQGYLLVTEDGTRIDDGPSKIVFDRDDSADVKGQITNGISCIACHSGGINLKLDQIREGALKAVPRGLRDEIHALYPVQTEMDRLQRADKARFLAAVERLGIRDGCDQTPCEVVRMLSLRFAENLTFERAAAEFGVEAREFREAFGGRLKPLRTQLEVGAVSRAEFINKFRDLVRENRDFGEMSGCGTAIPVVQPKVRPTVISKGTSKGTSQAQNPTLPQAWKTSWDAEVVRQDPDPAVVTDAAARTRMEATKLPWKVRDRKSGIVMLLCPPGEFMMGSPASEAGRDDDETQHRRVIRNAFYLSETEVTQEVWEKAMGANPSYFKGATKPVEQVSWNDCVRFCESTGLRLPTEAEWEYACRAGTTGAYAGDLASMAWFADNSNGRTNPVRQRKPNAWGLYDMHGNVWEWVADAYAEYPKGGGAEEAARAAEGGARVLRGGGWLNVASNCRAAFRGDYAPGGAHGNLGFRVARTPD